MRLDKFLCEMNIGTRSQVKTFIRQGLVRVNGSVVKAPELPIKEISDVITLRETQLCYQKFSYYMLNKPQGVVSATKDNTADTVLDLFPKELRGALFPVGRLDKDTEGLLLLTDDGELSHMLLSPKRHVDKTYLVGIAALLTDEATARLEQGVDIGEEKLTKPALVQILNEKEILLTIHEGKFHQVKRMLKAVDNEVLSLKRISFGSLKLDENLRSGAYRELTAKEVAALYEDAKLKQS